MSEKSPASGRCLHAKEVVLIVLRYYQCKIARYCSPEVSNIRDYLFAEIKSTDQKYDGSSVRKAIGRSSSSTLLDGC